MRSVTAAMWLAAGRSRMQEEINQLIPKEEPTIGWPVSMLQAINCGTLISEVAMKNGCMMFHKQQMADSLLAATLIPERMAISLSLMWG